MISYHDCQVCGALRDQPCVSIQTGNAIKKVHDSRKFDVEIPADIMAEMSAAHELDPKVEMAKIKDQLKSQFGVDLDAMFPNMDK